MLVGWSGVGRCRAERWERGRQGRLTGIRQKSATQEGGVARVEGEGGGCDIIVIGVFGSVRRAR